VRERPAVGTASDFRFRVDEAQDAAPALPDTVPPAPPPRARGARPFRWFLGSLGLLVVGILVFDAAEFVQAQWERHWALGALFTALLAATLVAEVAYELFADPELVAAAWRDFRSGD
jgi:hypothetical protein